MMIVAPPLSGCDLRVAIQYRVWALSALFSVCKRRSVATLQPASSSPHSEEIAVSYHFTVICDGT